MVYIFGLGNPGPEYEMTRHNVGVETLSRLAAFFQVNLKKRFFYKYRWARFNTPALGDVCLVFPLTFMNLSGEVVPSLVREGDEVIVICDQMDLPPGSLRIKNGGSSAGHNGLKSMLSHLPNNFKRVYIGVGRPEEGISVPDHVLSRFSDSDRLLVDRAEEEAVECLAAFLNGERFEKVQMKANSFKAE
ncbi:MAG: aminoacyl-tRNA hydrolase [Sphaerochaetaceae bacterium]|nr:aminoacyl-tRNA hydrolase [Sphaerochaetaceae bacterium]